MDGVELSSTWGGGSWLDVTAEAFEEVEIPCGPVNTIDQVARDPHVAERGMIAEVHHPDSGNFKVVNTPFKFSRTPCKVAKASPELGEHTDEVLGQLTGMTTEEISELRNSGVL